MLKIAHDQLAVVAARGAETIRQLSGRNEALEAENTHLRDKIASIERDQDIHVLAEEMEQKGLNAELTFEEKVAKLQRLSDLTGVKEAVKMASAHGVDLAQVSSVPGRLSGADAFSQFCITGERN